MKGNDYIEMDLGDAIMERPHGFTVGNRHFYLYPVTLGKTILLKRLVEELHVNLITMNSEPYIESLRLATQHKDICCRILTYHTMHTKAKIFDNEFVENRIQYFIKNIDTEALAEIMSIILMSDKTNTFMRYLKIDKENERFDQVLRIKKDKNNIYFGGKSVYGSIIDAACERYGWTKDYVVWGIDYTSLKMMLADKSFSIYLSDEELKHLPSRLRVKDRNVINMDDPKNKELIKQEDWR